MEIISLLSSLNEVVLALIHILLCKVFSAGFTADEAAAVILVPGRALFVAVL